MSLPFLSKSHRILFPISLVFFEFAVYIGNDMIQPAMLKVVEDFKVDSSWVPTSLTAYMAGGAALQWLIGPLSDKFGRRPIMLLGVLFFIVSCLSILPVTTIEQFTIMRFLQGMGLCFIGAVGYATIQEVFDEVSCVRLVAIMANVSISAPLLGPLIGTVLLGYIPWQGIFVVFAVLGFISFIGLFFYMPETVELKGRNSTLSIGSLWIGYKKVLMNSRFMCGALAIGFGSVPMLSWIAVSPVIIMEGEKLSIFSYALLQIPVFGGLIIGNLTLSYFAGKVSLSRLIKVSRFPIFFGLGIAASSMFFPAEASLLWMILGLSIYSFGNSMAFAGLTRLTLFASDVSKGTVSSAMGIIFLLIYILGIEIANKAYLFGSKEAFNGVNLLSGLLLLLFVSVFFVSKFKKDGNISEFEKC
ncbi:MFS transporter [Liberibacter sp. Z1]|nr:MFS transporter [Candidatus Liberibacter sp.]